MTPCVESGFSDGHTESLKIHTSSGLEGEKALKPFELVCI